MIKYVGFQPDVDPTTPGVITDCTDVIPTLRGMKARPSGIATLLPAIASTVLGAAVVVKLDNSSRMFAGTSKRIYEAATSSWTDRSKGGVDYTTGTFWRFTQFGNDTLAVNKVDIVQQSSTGAFSDVTGSPKASVIDAAAGFVMLGATNEGTYGDQPDRWWCSSYQDATSATAFTPSVTTQSTTGRLVDAPGPITGMKSLGSSFVAYKARSMFLGTYVGAPAVWSWIRVPGEIGCISHEAVVSITTAHIFIGDFNIYKYDGTKPVEIGNNIKKWFFSNLNKPYKNLIRGLHQEDDSQVWFFYPSITSTTNNSAIVYNYVTGTWGKCSIASECPVEYLSGLITYDGMGTVYSTWDDLPSLAYDSPFWLQTTQIPAIFDTAHTLKTLTGVSAGGSWVSGDMGDDSKFSTLTRTRPHFVMAPSSGTMTNYYRNNTGASLTIDQTTQFSNGKFDVIRSARWHRASYTFDGDFEVIGDEVMLIKGESE